jgi:hypothetical protein
MCTVSVIPIRPQTTLRLAGRVPGGVGFRIVCNRDEVRERAPAGPPKWRAIDRPGCPGARAIWPRDMEAGGTWIAAAEHGLALCLLNLNLEPPPDLRGLRGLKSRGLVIPSLIGAESAQDAMTRLKRLSLRAFAPFRLIAVDGRGEEIAILEARWDRQQLLFAHAAKTPACYVSSGLGDSLAAPRIGLFDRMVVNGNGPVGERQDEFHRHTWPDRPEISVMMSRPDARTVSVTKVEAVPDGRGLWDVTMDYQAVGEGGEISVGASIRRAAGAR